MKIIDDVLTCECGNNNNFYMDFHKRRIELFIKCNNCGNDFKVNIMEYKIVNNERRL